MPKLRVRIADKSEHASLNEQYVAWGYRGGVDRENALFVAVLDGRAVGLVRRAREDQLTLLRGMYVDPAHHREGIGSALLDRFVRELEGAECYCVPFTHLTGFYERAGFAVVSDADAPATLAERTRRYRAEGRDVLMMRRVVQDRQDGAG
jgi:predicted N-acetyltransferase YhbS